MWTTVTDGAGDTLSGVRALGQFLSSDWPEDRYANVRFQSGAVIGRRSFDGASSPKKSFALLLRWLAAQKRERQQYQQPNWNCRPMAVLASFDFYASKPTFAGLHSHDLNGCSREAQSAKRSSHLDQERSLARNSYCGHSGPQDICQTSAILMGDKFNAP